MKSGTFRSFAKINLHLQVVGRRGDGYHELRTVFQSIALHDLVGCRLTDGGVELEIAEGEAPAGADNLAYRAAELFLRRWAPDVGVRLELTKRIPVGGGLGGGSSNAATVLRALRRLLGRPESSQELWPPARELGADVPFFLVEGTALGVGRGDEVLPLPELPETGLWVVAPPVPVSTAAVFGRLRPPRPAGLDPAVLALARGATPPAADAFAGRNDLQSRVLHWYPEVRRVYNSLLGAGAHCVRLSGTGAALFAFFEEPLAEPELKARLPAGTLAFFTQTLNRTSVERRRVVR